MAKGYKIKRYSNIYRRHPRRRFTRAIRVILVVAVLFAVGWAVYQPVYDLLFPAGGESSSQPAELSSSLPEESSAPAAEEPVVLPQSAGGQMVYLPTEILADTASLPALLESLQAGGMQEILIDLKDAEGLVLYQSQVEAAASSLDPQYDLAQVTAAAQAAGVRVAGRLWAFQDRETGLIRIVVTRGELYSRIEVIDDGSGYDVENVRTDRLGLSIVQTMVKDKLRGNLGIESGDGGTHVTFDFKNQIVDAASVT